MGVTSKPMVYQLSDGQFIEGDTYEQLVKQMMSGKMSYPRSVKSYCKATAKRIYNSTGLEINFDNCEDFIMDLEHHGFARKVVTDGEG